MSVYQVQRCLFDYLRARERAGDGEQPDIAVMANDYELDDAERKAVAELDLGSLYAMGTHPVIVNGVARAMGYRRADYRPLLADSMPPEPTVTPRWRKH